MPNGDLIALTEATRREADARVAEAEARAAEVALLREIYEAFNKSTQLQQSIVERLDDLNNSLAEMRGWFAAIVGYIATQQSDDKDRLERIQDKILRDFEPKKREARALSETDLRLRLIEQYDEEELRTLCFDLGVDYDTLRGEGKEGKARELVAALKRRGSLSALADRVGG